MAKETCENKYGMTTNKRGVKHQRLSRAFSALNHHSAGNAHASLSNLGDEAYAHQTEQINTERWQQKIAENLLHSAFR